MFSYKTGNKFLNRTKESRIAFRIVSFNWAARPVLNKHFLFFQIFFFHFGRKMYNLWAKNNRFIIFSYSFNKKKNGRNFSASSTPPLDFFGRWDIVINLLFNSNSSSIGAKTAALRQMGPKRRRTNERNERTKKKKELRKLR